MTGERPDAAKIVTGAGADFLGAAFWTTTLTATFFTAFCWCRLRRSLLDSGSLGGDGFQFRRCRPLCSPPFLQSGHDVCPTSLAQFSFCLRRFLRRRRWQRRLSPDLGPSPPLGFLHPASSRCGEFPALAGWRFRCGGCGWFAATVQHGPKFCDLSINAGLLLLKTYDGGVKYFSGEFGCWHKQSVWLDSTLECEAQCLRHRDASG